MAISDEAMKTVTFLGTALSVLLSVGGLAYSAGHLTNRVANLEKQDLVHDTQIAKADKESDVIREQLNNISTQQSVIANDLSWLRRYLESKDK
ncbi:hypothetical protein ACXIUH_08905 [Vibrio parahaemolyticus]